MIEQMLSKKLEIPVRILCTFLLMTGFIALSIFSDAAQSLPDSDEKAQSAEEQYNLAIMLIYKDGYDEKTAQKAFYLARQ